jgi:hypothetical protein
VASGVAAADVVDGLHSTATAAWEAALRRLHADPAAASHDLTGARAAAPASPALGSRGPAPPPTFSPAGSADLSKPSAAALERATARASIEATLVAEAARLDAIAERAASRTEAAAAQGARRLEDAASAHAKRATFGGRLAALGTALRGAESSAPSAARAAEPSAAAELAQARAELADVRLTLGALTFYGQLRKPDVASLDVACSISHPAFAKPNARIIYDVCEIMRTRDRVRARAAARWPCAQTPPKPQRCSRARRCAHS